jgi:hypothetical protein
MITPDEARERVNEAVGHGAIQVIQIQTWKQRIAAHRGG